MTNRLATLLVVLLLVAAPAAAAAPGQLAVSLDRARVSTRLGRSFVFHSTIANHGRAPAAGMVAHLNVLSLRNGVYVDPEDWSSHRTKFLPPIPAGGSITVTWPMEAVNHGKFDVYVTLVSQRTIGRPPAIGPAVRIAVADRKTLNSGGILPLALGIPAFLGLLTLGLRRRRARRVRRGPGTGSAAARRAAPRLRAGSARARSAGCGVGRPSRRAG